GAGARQPRGDLGADPRRCRALEEIHRRDRDHGGLTIARSLCRASSGGAAKRSRSASVSHAVTAGAKLARFCMRSNQPATFGRLAQRSCIPSIAARLTYGVAELGKMLVEGALAQGFATEHWTLPGSRG